MKKKVTVEETETGLDHCRGLQYSAKIWLPACPRKTKKTQILTFWGLYVQLKKNEKSANFNISCFICTTKKKRKKRKFQHFVFYMYN